MRAREFLKEDHDNVPEVAKPALSRMISIPDMDGFYEFYRFMTMTAGEPDRKIPATGKLRDNPTALPYSDAEAEMIARSAQRMGKHPISLTPKGYQEPKDNNRTSPVAAIKKNKYGV
jgi:hypothetical protein